MHTTPIMSLGTVLEATGGDLVRGDRDLAILSVSTDSRSLEAGALYVPLVGERFDGHAYFADVAKRGAAAVLVARDSDVPEGPAVIRVDDTLLAYGRLARQWRLSLALTVVAVTGSSGKTSTKEVVADLLGRFMVTAKSHANFNNEIGVPRTLLDLRQGTWAVVLEMGMRGPGEIAYLADVARPNIGIVTNVGTAHIGRLGSRERIAAAKGELVEEMPKGRIVLNGDDPYCRALGKKHPRVVHFSVEGPDKGEIFAATELEPAGDHWKFRAMWRAGPETPAGNAIVRLPLPGAHHVANALAAIGVAWHLGIALSEEFTLAPPPVGGRSRVVAVGDVEILDESYNANPESARASIDGFCRLPAPGRRIVVMGEMAELGAFAEEAHEDLGRALDATPIDLVVTVGDLAGLIAKGTSKRSIRSGSNGDAVAALAAYLQAGDRILIKGSRASRMEEIVAGLSEALS